MKFRKFILSVALQFVLCMASFAQANIKVDTAAVNSIKKFQLELDAEYKNPKKTPLDPEELRAFNGHDYFPVDLKYRVEAILLRTESEPYFKMMTSNNKPRNFRQYGILKFTLLEKEFEIPVYQSENLLASAEYANYLFLPFTDLTNNHSSYGAGRYIDLRIPETGNTIIVDFNKAYNPLCAYSNQYSCPIVPAKNHLELQVKAGVRYTKSH